MATQLDFEDLRASIAPSVIKAYINVIHRYARAMHENENINQIHAWTRINEIRHELDYLGRIFGVRTYTND